MDPITITLLMFFALIGFLVTGFPIAFVLMSLGAFFAFVLWGPNSLPMVGSALLSQSGTIIMVAVPMFIFMGAMLERSGVAEKLYLVMHRWFGGLRGGLAIGTVGICTLFAAMTGISATACVSMGMTALPAMLKRGYDKNIAMGCIGAGSSLGILIPPSVPFVIYALVAQESVGKLLMSGFIPGFILSAMFMIYIGVIAYLKPKLAPALPPEERVGWREKFASLKYVALPLILVLTVLTVIFTGVTTPSEASAVGALGTIIMAAVHRNLNWKIIKESCYVTLRVTSMAVWIIVGAYAFSSVYQALGAVKAVETAIIGLQVNRWVIMALMQLFLIILGCLLDPVGIIMIAGPIMCPVAKALGFDLIWFGCTFVINLEIGYLTPPFGMNCFYLRALVPKGINMGDIYWAMAPFIVIMMLGLVLMLAFPQISLWLPSLMK
jgi:tripartite ATP-independent transporter DctM subunit